MAIVFGLLVGICVKVTDPLRAGVKALDSILLVLAV